MPTKVVVGVQWGDEGKGKIIDILASRAQVVVRSQGGNNAGHTVENGNEVYKLSLIPSGVLYPHTSCLVGCGVVVNPGAIIAEIDDLRARGVSCQNLRIDARVHLVMPWHITLDVLNEERLGVDSIGTTRRGIGPCYMDKAERTGLRLCDLACPNEFAKKARAAGERKNEIIQKIYGAKPLNLEEIIAEYLGFGQRLLPFMDDVSVLVWNARKEDKDILFEGAQGTLLDLDVGTYPYVTSSHPVSGGVCIGAGVGPTVIDEVIGVSKAYTTRVGAGVFPTELFDEVGDAIRDLGREYGTVTGRPRRIGWFDAVILRHAIRVNGLTSLAVNKLDTLRGLKTLKVCTAYKMKDGRNITQFPPSFDELAGCEPVYKELPGFFENISGCRNFEELPDACQDYIAFLEEACGCPVNMIGVGPGRTQLIMRIKSRI